MHISPYSTSNSCLSTSMPTNLPLLLMSTSYISTSSSFQSSLSLIVRSPSRLIAPSRTGLTGSWYLWTGPAMISKFGRFASLESWFNLSERHLGKCRDLSFSQLIIHFLRLLFFTLSSSLSSASAHSNCDSIYFLGFSLFIKIYSEFCGLRSKILLAIMALTMA